MFRSDMFTGQMLILNCFVWFNACRNGLHARASGMLLCIIKILKIPNQQNWKAEVSCFVCCDENEFILREGHFICIWSNEVKLVPRWSVFCFFKWICLNGYHEVWVQDICELIRNNSIYAKKMPIKSPFQRVEKWLRTS